MRGIATNECGHGQQRCLAEEMCEARRNVEGVDELALVLSDRLLCVIIRNLEPRARVSEVEVKLIFLVQLEIESIEGE